jgi:signal transduction histidine kinase
MQSLRNSILTRLVVVNGTFALLLCAVIAILAGAYAKNNADAGRDLKLAAELLAACGSAQHDTERSACAAKVWVALQQARPGRETPEVTYSLIATDSPSNAGATHLRQNEQWLIAEATHNGVQAQVRVRREFSAKMLLEKLTPAVTLLMILLLIFTAILSWVSAWFAARPILQLADDVGKLSVTDGRLLKIEGRYYDELVVMIKSINDRTEDARARIAAQKEFFTNAAHQLRTPLAIACAHAEDLNRNEFVPAQSIGLQRLRDGLASVGAILSRIFTIARLDAHLDFEIREIDVEKTAQQAISPLIDLVEKRHQNISLVSDSVVMREYAGTVESIVTVLVENAIKYAGDGAQLALTIQKSATGCSISVADDGPGLSAADLEHLFQRFYRGTQSTESDGSGLGLSILHALVRRAGGTVQVAKGLDGRGVRFTVQLGSV